MFIIIPYITLPLNILKHFRITETADKKSDLFGISIGMFYFRLGYLYIYYYNTIDVMLLEQHQTWLHTCIVLLQY